MKKVQLTKSQMIDGKFHVVEDKKPVILTLKTEFADFLIGEELATEVAG